MTPQEWTEHCQKCYQRFDQMKLEQAAKKKNSFLYLPLLVVFFISLYEIKRFLGIDIFPEHHLQDILPWYPK